MFNNKVCQHMHIAECLLPKMSTAYLRKNYEFSKFNFLYNFPDLSSSLMFKRDLRQKMRGVVQYLQYFIVSTVNHYLSLE
jgi:hypothetical protein